MSTLTCPRCGKRLAPDAPGGLCAELPAGRVRRDDGLGIASTSLATMSSGSRESTAWRRCPRPSGSAAAGCRLLLRWSRGRSGDRTGSGVCWDAAGWGRSTKPSTSTSGRRVALKVLRNRLQTPGRARAVPARRAACRVGQPSAYGLHLRQRGDRRHAGHLDGTADRRHAEGSRRPRDGPMRPDEAVAAVHGSDRRPRCRRRRRHPASRHQAVELLHRPRRRREGWRLRAFDLHAGARRSPAARHLRASRARRSSRRRSSCAASRSTSAPTSTRSARRCITC